MPPPTSRRMGRGGDRSGTRGIHGPPGFAMTRTSVSLALGGAAWMLIMMVYAIGMILWDREGLMTGLVYNAPIALLFLVLAAEVAICFINQGVRRTLAERGPMVALWLVGLVLLFLRLGTPRIEVSGHMVWLPMLTVQSLLLRFPAWLTGVGVAGTLIAAWLKFAVFRGPSGVPGLLVGTTLALLLVILSRGIAHVKGTASK